MQSPQQIMHSNTAATINHNTHSLELQRDTKSTSVTETQAN